MDTELLSVTAEVTQRDDNRARFYQFTVPVGATTLWLSFEVDPPRVGPYNHAISVHLHDPVGSRGTPGRADVPPRIRATHATPGLVARPLQPGTWWAEVIITYVVAGQRCTYRLRIWLEDDVDVSPQLPPQEFPTAIAGTEPGWYAGDLHMHTHHSDGRWSPAALWRAVRERRLDFFALTDHNTLTDQDEVAALATGKVLPIPGIEVTMRGGHLLALGVDSPIDWRVGRNGRTIHDVLSDVHAAGGVAIIAHPGSDGSPICHGCRWDYSGVDPREVDAVEVWNARWHSGEESEDNERSLCFYDRWLAAGYRVSMSGGSDEHGEQTTFADGVPSTYVFARELSRAAILEGIRAGHSVLSSGPMLRVTATSGDATAMPGDTLPVGRPLHVDVAASGVAGRARLTIIGNGRTLAEIVVDGEGSCHYTCTHAIAGWYRAELRSLDDGEMLAIASPFFVA